MPVSFSFCCTTRWNQRGHESSIVSRRSVAHVLADDLVDARLLVAALLRKLERPDQQIQDDADVRDQEDREQPRHRRGRLAPSG
jgi:hypothetical protein